MDNKIIELIPVTDERFLRYGKIIDSFDMQEILAWMEKEVEIPNGLTYVPREEAFMVMPIAGEIENRFFGGMTTNLGWVAGHGTRMDALEFHKCSEINMGLYDFVLLLGRREDISEDGILDTDLVEAFYIPAGVLVEMYAGTLHYAPRSYDLDRGYCVFAACLAGTNSDAPCITPKSVEDKHLAGKNKWLYAHKDSGEVQNDGAPVGMTGWNIDIEETLKSLARN